MPGFIAHFMVCKAAYDELKADADYSNFLECINYKELLYLGALGPDIPYYQSSIGTVGKMIMDKSDKPQGIDGWSYQLHSKDTDTFPLKLIEIVRREANIPEQIWVEFGDYKKLAFIFGYLTHMAADRIIHPIVNTLAGPYYKHGLNREKHRQIEVYQDIFLYNTLIDYNDFSKDDFSKYINLNNWSQDDSMSFVYFLQQGFVEAHAVTPEHKEILTSLKNLCTFLKYINKIGMYKSRYEEFQSEGTRLSSYKDYFQEVNYIDAFRNAVELAKVYARVYMDLLFSEEIDDSLRASFKKVIKNIDLTSPIEENILEEALRDYRIFNDEGF